MLGRICGTVSFELQRVEWNSTGMVVKSGDGEDNGMVCSLR